MPIDEKRRGEIIMSPDVEPTAAQLEELRETAETVVHFLSEDPLNWQDVPHLLKNMLRVFRPLSGEDIRHYASDDDKPH